MKYDALILSTYCTHIKMIKYNIRGVKAYRGQLPSHMVGDTSIGGHCPIKSEKSRAILDFRKILVKF